MAGTMASRLAAPAWRAGLKDFGCLAKHPGFAVGIAVGEQPFVPVLAGDEASAERWRTQQGHIDQCPSLAYRGVAVPVAVEGLAGRFTALLSRG
jgi:hypothetical protein